MSTVPRRSRLPGPAADPRRLAPRWHDPRWRRDAGFAAGACAVLAVYNNTVAGRPWHRRWYPLANACAAGAALAAAAAGGLTAADLGLERGSLGAGWRLGARAAGPVVASWLLVALAPAARPLLRDQRIMGSTGREVAYQVLVRIPAGTVGWEEVAFRGVLQAALRRVMPAPAAVAVAAGVFGVWHVRPTLEALQVNRVRGGRAALAAGTGGAVAATAGAGCLLSWLRDRSGSLAAPMLVHLAANCPGLVATWAVTRWADPPARRRETAPALS